MAAESVGVAVRPFKSCWSAAKTLLAVGLPLPSVWSKMSCAVAAAVNVAPETSATPTDSAAINQAISNVKSASVWLNNNLAFYGTVQNRISSSMTIAGKYQTEWTQQISGIRDADTAAVASDLQATHTQQSAALAAEANFQPHSLFDYMQ